MVMGMHIMLQQTLNRSGCQGMLNVENNIILHKMMVDSCGGHIKQMHVNETVAIQKLAIQHTTQYTTLGGEVYVY